MTTEQFAIFFMLYLIQLVANLYYEPNSNSTKRIILTVVGFLAGFIVFLLAVLNTNEMMKLKSTTPCPTLEPVSNVYKIK